MKRLNQTGSHIVALAFGVLVLGGIGFAGYTVVQHSANKNTNVADQTVLTPAATKAAITTKADLSKTAKALDSSSASLNSSLDSSGLNSSLNDLL